MPFSNPSLREVVKSWLVRRFPKGTPIVDIGAGAGAYGDALHGEFVQMTAIEPFEKYIQDYKLRSKYQQVLNEPVSETLKKEPWRFKDSVVIMGDVLEHFTPEDARALLDRLKALKPKAIVVVVPYLYEQGPEHPDVVKFGNPLEVHLQPDLTPELVTERYPELRVIARNGEIGAYYWTPEE